MPSNIELSNAGGVFASAGTLEFSQRAAKALASSSIVPEGYRANIPNVLVAMDMAVRLNLSPLEVMQNLHIIHGRPSWSSPFIIASINTSGRFAPLRYEMETRGHIQFDGRNVENLHCRAVTTDRGGNKIEGPWVSIEMAILEGWYGKKGSKWRTMPELMCRYRAAAFFGRLYAPEIMLGMHTSEEVADTVDAGAAVVMGAPDALREINRRAAAMEAEPEIMEAEVLPDMEPGEGEGHMQIF